ncbi:MAG: hypothetical protein SFU83_00470 [Meiothermus sp.]|nr:hypothetical protein [Meiothermus sp.]
MTILPGAQQAVREVLRDRAAQVSRLEALCESALRDLERRRVWKDSRERLLLRLLSTSLERYRVALRQEGAAAPPVHPAARADLEAIAVACSELRDQTWVAWRVVMDGGAENARFLEGQALELEFILRALDYVQHSQQSQAPAHWFGRDLSH